MKFDRVTSCADTAELLNRDEKGGIGISEDILLPLAFAF
jgi:hypothetical protein